MWCWVGWTRNSSLCRQRKSDNLSEHDREQVAHFRSFPPFFSDDRAVRGVFAVCHGLKFLSCCICVGGTCGTIVRTPWVNCVQQHTFNGNHSLSPKVCICSTEIDIGQLTFFSIAAGAGWSIPRYWLLAQRHRIHHWHSLSAMGCLLWMSYQGHGSGSQWGLEHLLCWDHVLLFCESCWTSPLLRSCFTFSWVTKKIEPCSEKNNS